MTARAATGTPRPRRRTARTERAMQRTRQARRKAMRRDRVTEIDGRLPSLLVAGLLVGAGCADPPDVPAQPTWTEVAPILRGQCSSCHGSTADVSGAGYRFDFYDM